MNQDQDNITTMFETVDVVLTDNKSIWSGMKAFADSVTNFETGIEAIREKQAGQVKTGDTDAKQDARDAVEAQTLYIASQLSALAAKTSDPILAAKVKCDQSSLDKAALSDLLTTAKAVQSAAADNAAVLTSDYNVTATMLTAFGTAITTLGGMKDAPRNATVQKRVETLSLPGAIAYVRGILRNEIDKMIIAFKASQPDFYAAYFAARVIIDRTGTHKGKKPVSPTPPAPPVVPKS
ncbi:MAG TPA: hypothetical protein VHW03_07715 [Chthoniobacterales bacterium]|nr:hypothetical protein [Chthoniobacterales bacterium]